MNTFEKTKFSVSHPDGSTVRGIRFKSDSAGKRPAVIICHGFNGCYAGSLDRGEAFSTAGIDCWLFDFRGGGEYTASDGKLSEMMTTETECADLKLIIKYVLSQPETDGHRLFLQGESQGGLICTLVAEELPSLICGLILWYPALLIPEASRERLQKGVCDVFGIRLSPDFDRIAAKLDPWIKMKDYPGNVLLIHGDSDPVVPLEYSKKALSFFPNAKLKVIPGAGHGFSDIDLKSAILWSVSEATHIYKGLIRS